jgi:hypothetical protein
VERAGQRDEQCKTSQLFRYFHFIPISKD